MAAVPDSRPRAPWLRGKYLLFACIALMAAYVIRHNERFLVDRSAPFWQHIETFKWWLLAHGLAGACALILAPLQFSDRLRLRLTKMHRIGGTRSETIATGVFAILLMSTTSIALFFILNRKIPQHRQWMTRSYAVALVFFEVRVIGGIFRLDDNAAASDTVFWICLVLAIPLADLILQFQESRRARIP